jgi:nucleotide-binding universal stress UspA family protein
MNEPLAPERVRRVLVAVDFSPASSRALEWAARQAARRGAELHVLHAVDTYGALDIAVPVAVTEIMRNEAQERLAEVTRPLRDDVRAVFAAAEIGTPAGVLLDAVKRLGPELLVVGTRGLGGWQHALLGSTAHRLIAGAGCPVLAVHEHDAPPPDRPLRLVAGTDGSEESALAIRAAAQLFQLERGAVLVHAFQPPPLIDAGLAYGVVYDIGTAGRTAAKARLAGEAAKLAAEGVDVQPALRDGFAPDEILAAAQSLPADLIVMGSRGRGGLAHVLLGSTAERVVQRASMPVLVVPRRAARILDELATSVAIATAPADEQC